MCSSLLKHIASMGSSATLGLAVARGQWAPKYLDHPVVREAAAGEVVWPLAIFCDKVPYQSRDSTLVFYAYNIVTATRHLVMALRSSELCRCGCQGWCTLFVVMQWLLWSLRACASGRWPASRHDGKPFATAGDAHRASMVDEPLFKGALVHILGDWAEISHTWGFPDWSNVLHPCYCCTSVKDDLRQVGSLSPLSEPWPMKDHAAYVRACNGCERLVQVTSAESLARLLGYLSFTDRGYELEAPLAELGLEAGDKLMPSLALPDLDIRRLSDIRAFPQVLTFWRPRNVTMAKWRNPIFQDDIGVSVRSFSIDVMHTLNLGTYKAFCMTCIWWMLVSDIWEVGASGGRKQLLAEGFTRFRTDLAQRYAAERRRQGP